MQKWSKDSCSSEVTKRNCQWRILRCLLELFIVIVNQVLFIIGKLVFAGVNGDKGNENEHSSQVSAPAADSVHCSG